MDELKLTAEQELSAAEIEDVVRAKMAVEAKELARLLASKSNAELFGATEFVVRQRVQGLGARVLEAALEERNSRICSRRRTGVPRVQRDLSRVP